MKTSTIANSFIETFKNGFSKFNNSASVNFLGRRITPTYMILGFIGAAILLKIAHSFLKSQSNTSAPAELKKDKGVKNESKDIFEIKKPSASLEKEREGSNDNSSKPIDSKISEVSQPKLEVLKDQKKEIKHEESKSEEELKKIKSDLSEDQKEEIKHEESESEEELKETEPNLPEELNFPDELKETEPDLPKEDPFKDECEAKFEEKLEEISPPPSFILEVLSEEAEKLKTFYPDIYNEVKNVNQMDKHNAECQIGSICRTNAPVGKYAEVVCLVAKTFGLTEITGWALDATCSQNNWKEALHLAIHFGDLDHRVIQLMKLVHDEKPENWTIPELQMIYWITHSKWGDLSSLPFFVKMEAKSRRDKFWTVALTINKKVPFNAWQSEAWRPGKIPLFIHELLPVERLQDFYFGWNLDTLFAAYEEIFKSYPENLEHAANMEKIASIDPWWTSELFRAREKYPNTYAASEALMNSRTPFNDEFHKILNFNPNNFTFSMFSELLGKVHILNLKKYFEKATKSDVESAEVLKFFQTLDVTWNKKYEEIWQLANNTCGFSDEEASTIFNRWKWVFLDKFNEYIVNEDLLILIQMIQSNPVAASEFWTHSFKRNSLKPELVLSLVREGLWADSLFGQSAVHHYLRYYVEFDTTVAALAEGKQKVQAFRQKQLQQINGV